MHIYRLGDTWWFRKAVPVDLIETLGVSDVRLSLRTSSKSVAQRKALRMLIRVNDVYEVLRAQAPQRVSRDIAMAILEEGIKDLQGNPELTAIECRALRDAATSLDGMTLPPPCETADPADTGLLVLPRDALWLMRQEKPLTDANRAAVALVDAAADAARLKLNARSTPHRKAI